MPAKKSLKQKKIKQKQKLLAAVSRVSNISVIVVNNEVRRKSQNYTKLINLVFF